MSWLDEIEVAAPCKASWEKMDGDARVRFCGLCKLNVYNLSGMSREEAEKLVAGSNGRVCATFFRRADGTVLTQDCPVGLLARVRRRTVAVVGWFLAFVGLGSMGALALRVVEKPVSAPFIPARTMGRISMPSRGCDTGPVGSTG